MYTVYIYAYIHVSIPMSEAAAAERAAFEVRLAEATAGHEAAQREKGWELQRTQAHIQ